MSVLEQSYPEIELIVVDDGSSDGTPAIAKSFGSHITYIRQDNAGAATALNRGIDAASGSLVAWLSSDDVYLPNKIATQVDLLDGDPDVVASYTDFVTIDANGHERRTVRSPFEADRRRFVRRLILGNFINGSSVVARKAALIEAGLFDPRMVFHADALMWMRLLTLGGFGHAPEVLLKYRIHAGAASQNLAGMKAFRYLLFDEVWALHPADTVTLPGEDPNQFVTRALISNGLYDRAWDRIRRDPHRWQAVPDLVGSWLRERVRRAAGRPLGLLR